MRLLMKTGENSKHIIWSLKTQKNSVPHHNHSQTWRDGNRVVLSWVASSTSYHIYNTIWSPPKAAAKKIWKQYFWIVFFINKFDIQPLRFQKKTACGGLETLFIQRITIRFFQGMLFLLINSLFGYFSGNAVSINKLVFASGPIPGESVRSERENTIQFRMA